MSLFDHIVILCGGGVIEREVSLTSGQAVYQTLVENNIKATLLDVMQDDYIGLLKAGNFSCAFVALHGGFGENGTIQGLLECLEVPYTGSGVLASALAMDKKLSKIVLKSRGLPVLPTYSVSDNFSDADFPLVLKPNSQGSSFGVYKIHSKDELLEKYAESSKYGEAIIEPWVTGPEFTSGIIGDLVLPSIHIVPDGEFSTFDSKYISDVTKFICPGSEDNYFEKELARIAKSAFDALGLRGWGRADFMVSENRDIYILELNTIPGLTSHSLVPTAARQIGISFFELICRIIKEVNVEPKSTSEKVGITYEGCKA